MNAQTYTLKADEFSLLQATAKLKKKNQKQKND